MFRAMQLKQLNVPVCTHKIEQVFSYKNITIFELLVTYYTIHYNIRNVMHVRNCIFIVEENVNEQLNN